MAKKSNGYNVKIIVEDNSGLIKSEMDRRVQMCLEEAGMNGVAGVVDYMTKIDYTGKDIVDTGRLRGSISFITDGKTSGPNSARTATNTDADALNVPPGNVSEVYVGTNVEYANDVEFGLGQKPRHYVENGVANSLPTTKDHIEKIIKGEY